MGLEFRQHHISHRTKILFHRLGLSVPLALLALTLPIGCASYQLGTQTLYRPDIQSVHVPIFESDSYRRNLGEWLTEAVVKEIQLKTPYKIASSTNADSVLSGRILSETKRVLAEDINDVPRNVETNFVVQVVWQSPQGDLLHPAMSVPLPPILQVGQAANFIPEGGQSVASAHQRAIQQLAEQIVAQMEQAW